MNILKRKSAKKGTSSVEAVIILPVLVMLTFGGLKYGVLFLRAQQITNVARQACRLAIRPYSDNVIVNAEIDRLMTAIGLGSEYDPPAYLDEADTATTVDAVGTGESLTLRLTVSTDNIDNLTLVNWLPLPDDIQVEITMSKEGPSS
ncbi:MAG: TadE/TadG family type IV pilus assembly protein [Planctomycetota bacterium]|jgi:hypothetical protein